jgi:hypothetical protein
MTNWIPDQVRNDEVFGVFAGRRFAIARRSKTAFNTETTEFTEKKQEIWGSAGRGESWVSASLQPSLRRCLRRRRAYRIPTPGETKKTFVIAGSSRNPES